MRMTRPLRWAGSERCTARTPFLVAFAFAAFSGVAPPGSPPAPALVLPAEDTRHHVVVASGESRFSVIDGASAPLDPKLDDVLRWVPYAAVWRALAQVVHWGVNWLSEAERKASTAPHVQDLAPRAVVADAFARALLASGRFQQVTTLDREPVGADRRGADVIVRLTVPTWGLLRVREGKPALVSGFADVRAQVVAPETGAILWEHEEDVTHPERLPLETFSRDRQFARQEMIEVLERAGRRLATEYLYARRPGR